MARTRSIKKQQGEPITAAALPLYPKSPVSDSYSRNISDYIINQSDGSDETAWQYFRTIPELHYLVTLMGNALSQVKFYLAETDASDPNNPNPKEVGPRHPARNLLRDFAGGEQGQAELMNRMAVQLTVTGDLVLVGPSPTSAPLQWPYDQWRVYSTTEVSSRNGRIYVKGPNYREDALPGSAMAVRVWRQNPQEFWRADSPVKSAFAVLREIELLNQHVQATSLSRLKTAGIFAIAEEFTLPGSEVEVEGEDGDPFSRILTEVMELAIKNPGSAAALVPIILRGPGEMIQNGLRLIDFSNPFDQLVPDLRNNALRRLALGMDAPPEILLGSAESSSWSMWQISEAQLRLHIKPLSHLIAASLTEGWLRPALDQLPLADQTKEGIPSLVIWPDFSALNIRPDVGQDAQALYDAFEIGGDTFRHILGLGEGEKPTPTETEYQIYLHTLKTNPQMAAWAVKGLKEHFDIPFIDSDGANAVGMPEPPPIQQPGVGTPPKATPTGSAPQTPGPRSVKKQTSPQKAPPADGDTSNNQG